MLEFETLLKEREIDISRKRLKKIDEETNPNYSLLYKAIKDQKYNHLDELISGYRGCALEGSSRSGKTWSRWRYGKADGCLAAYHELFRGAIH